MGWAAYVNVRIHTTNQEDMDKFIQNIYRYQYFACVINTYVLYKHYIQFFLYSPRSTQLDTCKEIVQAFPSFFIWTEWHEELNPEHGYYIVQWNKETKEVESQEIKFVGTGAEQRGEFNESCYPKKNNYPVLEHIPHIKERIYKKLQLPKTHIGYYSIVWTADTIFDSMCIAEKLNATILHLPKECIRWHIRGAYQQQLLLWTPKPLYEYNDDFTDIRCESWSSDGKKGIVWVKENDINEVLEFDYPSPFLPPFRRKCGKTFEAPSPPKKPNKDIL